MASSRGISRRGGSAQPRRAGARWRGAARRHRRPSSRRVFRGRRSRLCHAPSRRPRRCCRSRCPSSRSCAAFSRREWRRQSPDSPGACRRPRRRRSTARPRRRWGSEARRGRRRPRPWSAGSIALPPRSAASPRSSRARASLCRHNFDVPKRVAVDEVAAHNERMWERLAKAGIPYTRPQGTPPRTRAGKRRFFDRITNGTLEGVELEGRRALSLAGGGGWDAILFAELGAATTLVDISRRQLATVRALAGSRGTELDYLRTDMRDLSALGSGEFDVVFHQHSLVFVPDAGRVIAEVARVLAAGGVYVFSTMHPVTFLFYESWTGTGWRPKKTYFNDRPVPVLQPTWEFGRVKVHAPTYEYAHRTADLVKACVAAGLYVDGLWEWSPHYDGGPAGSDDALEQKLPAFIQIRARKPSSSGHAGNGSRRRTDPPTPPPLPPPPRSSPPAPSRIRAR